MGDLAINRQLDTDRSLSTDVLWNPINNLGGNAANDNVLYIQLCYWVATLQ
ncbi:MAG: hypothetical protein ABSA33_03785 [Candidatus Micrarchaeaceae archaeon]|jgi:hypothetical protein